jgi:hypothetical protein
MLARFRFAAFAAVSCAGLAGSSAFAQEATTELPDPVTQDVVELQLATAPGGEDATILYEVQAADQALAVAGDVVVEETAEAAQPAGLWLGVQLATEIPPALAHHLGDAKGALVETVYPDSPAAESGIEAYDLIIRVGEADVDSHEKLVETMKSVEAKPIDVVVLRGSDKKTISVTPRERVTDQPQTTATGQITDQFFYSVPHIRVLPALGGPDAGAFHHRLVTAYGPPASLPENVESMKVRIERDGEKTVHHVEVTTVDGKTFKAANEEELKAFPPEILAALPLPQNGAKFALRMDAAPGAPVQQRLIVQAAPGVPATAVPLPQVAGRAPGALPTLNLNTAWVDIIRHRDPSATADVTYKAVRVSPPGEEFDELKRELSDLRAAIGRIEKLLRKDE